MNKSAMRSPRRSRVCEICDAIYDATWTGQRTCGRACGAKINASYGRLRPEQRKRWPSSPVWFPECRQCGKVFAARSQRLKLCSDECRLARNVDLDPRRRPLDERRCLCGSPLVRLRRKLCDVCRQQGISAARARAKRRRRAARKGAASEPYTLAEIAVRDRNTCQLCKRRVAMTKLVPHPKAPVIDHVLPLARGGDDTRANVQLAHFMCNSVKSAGGSQQLALVG